MTGLDLSGGEELSSAFEPCLSFSGQSTGEGVSGDEWALFGWGWKRFSMSRCRQ